MKRRIPLLLALLVPPSSPAFAQSDDAIYCTKLSSLARSYLGQPVRGKVQPDADTMIAINNCEQGNAKAGIPVLERKLLEGGFTLPKRS